VPEPTRSGVVPGRPALTRRRLLAAGAGAAVAAVLSGCHVPVIDPAVDRSGKRKLIGLSLYADDPYTRSVASGVAAALKGSGYALLARRADLSATKEAANLQSFINRKTSGFVVLPVAVETATRGAQMAQSASIAVIDALYPGPNGNADKYYAGAIAYGGQAGGAMLASAAAKAAPRGGQVIVVQGLLGQGASETLDRGLDATLARHPNLRVVARGPGGLTAAGALAMVRAAFASNPRANVVIDYGAVMGDAIAGFLQATGRRNVVHLTTGATPQTPRWLGTPYLKATLYWPAAEVGRQAASTLLSVLRDEDQQADPFLHMLDQRVRTSLQGVSPNASATRVQVLPPAPQTEIEPLPQQGPAATSTSPG
jgi:ribose transport system substrate-binding protein